MIRPLTVELKILIYIIAYGIYYFAISDLVIFIDEKFKLKNIKKIILEFIYLITQIFITYNFCYKLAVGYIPIYFLLFIIIGFLLYYLFMREYFLKTCALLTKLMKKTIPFFRHLLYSKTIIVKLFKKLQALFHKFKNIFQKKGNNKNNKNQNT